MSNRKLTYEVLDDLIGTKGIHLEVANVDVKRLRDDRSEIVGGQDIAFVATTTFRATSNAVAILKQTIGNGDIAVGDALFVIGPDAELRSEVLEIDEDSVALWLDEHYTFTFTLNGVNDTKKGGPFQDLGPVSIAPTGPGHARDTLVLPWLRKLNTGVFKDGYIDVDVRITENDVQPPSDPAVTTRINRLKMFTMSRSVPNGTNEDEIETLAFDVRLSDGNRVLADLPKNGLRVLLDGTQPPLYLMLIPQTSNTVDDKTKSAESARPAASNTPPKHRP